MKYSRWKIWHAMFRPIGRHLSSWWSYMMPLRTRTERWKTRKFWKEILLEVSKVRKCKWWNGWCYTGRLYTNAEILSSNLGQSSGSYHYFNLTSFGQDERVIKAEFRWFRRKHPYMGRHHFYKVSWAFTYFKSRFKYAVDYTVIGKRSCSYFSF